MERGNGLMIYHDLMSYECTSFYPFICLFTRHQREIQNTHSSLLTPYPIVGGGVQSLRWL